MIQTIMSQYLLKALLACAVSIGFGFLQHKLGSERTRKIKEALLHAMLWAEEEFGIGQGNKKWEEAWQKLLEILNNKNIKLKEKEIKELKIMMKSNINKINHAHYGALLQKKAFHQSFVLPEKDRKDVL